MLLTKRARIHEYMHSEIYLGFNLTTSRQTIASGEGKLVLVGEVGNNWMCGYGMSTPEEKV